MTKETIAKMFFVSAKNYRENFNKDDALVIQTIWFEKFASYPDELIQDAFDHVFRNCKQFPTVFDIQKAVNEKQNEKRYTTEPWLMMPEYFNTAQAKAVLHKVMDMLEDGNIPKYDLADELRQYAKSLFPDISDELIYRNYNELAWCMEWEKKCNMCLWTPADCDLHGHQPYLKINKNGSMTEYVKPCKKKTAKAGVA